MKCSYCLNYFPKFHQLIIGKIIRIIATTCQIFFFFGGGKNVQNSISAGVPPHTPFGERTALLRWWSLCPPTPWLHLRGPTSKGGRVKRRLKRRVEKEFGPPNLHHRSMPLTSMMFCRSPWKLRCVYTIHRRTLNEWHRGQGDWSVCACTCVWCGEASRVGSGTERECLQSLDLSSARVKTHIGPHVHASLLCRLLLALRLACQLSTISDDIRGFCFVTSVL